MKKILTALILIVSAGATHLYSQTQNWRRDADPRRDFYWGLRAGTNISDAIEDHGEGMMPDPKFGMAAGALVSVPFGKWFGIQPECLFSQKGYFARGTAEGQSYSYIQLTNYMDFPLQLQYKPAKTSTILIGPQYSYLFYRTELYGSGTLTQAEKTIIRNDAINKNAWSATIGYDYAVYKVLFSVRLCMDMSPVTGAGTSLSPRYMNGWFQATVGVKL